MQNLYDKYVGCGYQVTTDSRAIKGGEIFFALKGENFDGNLYAAGALEAGASWAVVSKSAELPENDRFIKVDDPFVTLQQLATYHRQHVLGGKHLPVIGLTGTNGKTTTKELIAAVLGKKYSTTATRGNLNNDIGVPLSLLTITPGTEIAVIEMGASHPDDIAKLVKVCMPDYGLITNVGKAHLLGFGSFDGVKAAKGELYNWLGSHEGSVIFLNEDDTDLREMASAQPCHCYGYGIGYQGVQILPTSPDEPFLRIRIGERQINTHLIGAYNATNVLAALAIGEYFGVPSADADAAVEGFVPTNNRSQMTRTGRNTLIVDAYNANPSSMAAALKNFSLMEAPRKTAMLGDMRELGADSLKEHDAVMAAVLGMISEGSLDRAFVVGEEFGKVLAGIRDRSDVSASVRSFGSSDELAAFIREHAIDGEAVLIKGSRGIQMEKVIPEL